MKPILSAMIAAALLVLCPAYSRAVEYGYPCVGARAIGFGVFELGDGWILNEFQPGFRWLVRPGREEDAAFYRLTKGLFGEPHKPAWVVVPFGSSDPELVRAKNFGSIGSLLCNGPASTIGFSKQTLKFSHATIGSYPVETEPAAGDAAPAKVTIGDCTPL